MRAKENRIRKFHEGIVEEFFESAEFLYVQRVYLRDMPGFDWRELDKSDGRMAAALDGLGVGGEETLRACATASEPAALHVACRVFIRWGMLENLLATLIVAGSKSAAHVAAVADALCLEPAGAWHKELMQLAKRNKQASPSFAALAKLAGFARVPMRPWLHRRIEKNEVVTTAVWALGRLPRAPVSVGKLQPLLASDDLAVRTAAAVTLLRLGDASVAAHCEWAVQRGEAWAALPLALGSRNAAPLLALALATATVPEYLDALAVWGDTARIEALLNALDDKALAPIAARGLHRLTGVALVPPRAPRADELFAAEVPAPAPTLAQLWRAWWRDNHARFPAGTRFIFGKPASRDALIDCLDAPTLARRHRDLAYDELVIRHRAPIAFETDFSTHDQAHAIAALRAWSASEKA